MFSEAYREEVHKHPFIQDGWEPKFGDWVLTKPGDYIGIWAGTAKALGDEKLVNVIITPGEPDFPYRKWDENLLFLPTLRQLLDMLEERGYEGSLSWRKGICLVILFEGLTEKCYVRFPSSDDYWKAPDPETAALRALGEVAKEER